MIKKIGNPLRQLRLKRSLRWKLDQLTDAKRIVIEDYFILSCLMRRAVVAAHVVKHWGTQIPNCLGSNPAELRIRIFYSFFMTKNV